MAEIDQVCAQVQTYMKAAFAGLRAAPATLTDSANLYPFSSCFPASGTITTTSYPNKIALHKIALTIHMPAKDTARNLEVLLPYVEAVPNLLFQKLWHDNYWNSTITTFESVDYAFVTVMYGGVSTHALQFTINGVKVRGVIP